MELLVIAFTWPLLFLVVGLVFISLTNISGTFFIFAILFFLFLVFGLRNAISGGVGTSKAEELEIIRRGMVAFSVALLLPLFVYYLLEVSERTLSGMILCLILGFGVAIWGMFVKNNKVLTYGNVIGGVMVIVYLYSQLWSLGELPRIVASAFGLAVAVIIAVVKLRDRLT